MLRWRGLGPPGATSWCARWPSAGAAGAATPERAFRVKLTGTLTKDWTVSRTVEGECTEVTTAQARGE